ncbi:hypothetical protein L1987_75071 [Smallanthus sonchifolius]|uniref:Uncharacterized protein n=1 Tax=Smallanthus sonchifolius TaxID=185202 RepID=A0ACB9A3N9_9ASTR|nr:hypothetical protein L1987_75071 [Smallanthus sonchifolius]
MNYRHKLIKLKHDTRASVGDNTVSKRLTTDLMTKGVFSPDEEAQPSLHDESLSHTTSRLTAPSDSDIGSLC